jgi:hypothetical protein
LLQSSAWAADTSVSANVAAMQASGWTGIVHDSDMADARLHERSLKARQLEWNSS